MTKLRKDELPEVPAKAGEKTTNGKPVVVRSSAEPPGFRNGARVRLRTNTQEQKK